MDYALEELLLYAVEVGASDVHITVGIPTTLRVQGKLIPYGEKLLTKVTAETMAKSIITADRMDTLKKKGKVDFSFFIRDTARFRAHAFMQRGSIGLTIRVIPHDPSTVQELELPLEFERIIDNKQGLALITGPSGSGKSTTISSMIEYVNTCHHKHVITLESPIEYLHPHKKSIVNQREVGYDTETYATGLRDALRGNADIIHVGEINNYETLVEVLKVVEMGHLVIGSLNTSGVEETKNHLLDLCPSDQKEQVKRRLTKSLLAIVSQWLVPTTEGLEVPAFEITMYSKPIKVASGDYESSEKTLTLQEYLYTLNQRGIVSSEVVDQYK